MKPLHERWLAGWREVAKWTDGLSAQDPRYRLVMIGLSCADDAFSNGDWPAFQRAAREILRVMTTGGTHA